MKYFNKEDIEYKNEIESIERKFGEQNGISLLLGNIGTTSSSNPNNTDITYIDNDPFKFEIYPKTGKYGNVESNVQILKQKFLSVKDPLSEKETFQISFGTSSDSIWDVGYIANNNIRECWEISDSTTFIYNNYEYASVNNNKFSDSLLNTTRDVYKDFAKLIMGDREKKISIKNSDGYIEFDEALFININNDLKFDDCEIIFTSTLNATEYFNELIEFPWAVPNSENHYLDKIIKIKNNNDTLKIKTLNNNTQTLILDNLDNQDNLYNRETSMIFFRRVEPPSTSTYRFSDYGSDFDSKYRSLYKTFKIGCILPKYNLIILKPSFNIYYDSNLTEKQKLHLVMQTSLITSTAFINGLYLKDDLTLTSDILVTGSCHYNDKTFVNIVTTDSDDSYFELLMGFKARLERLYLTEKRQKTIAEYTCVAEQQEFNYSNNQSFLDENGSIINVIPPDPDSEDGQVQQSATTYITKIGLYNAQNQLLAVGSLSEPIKKDFNTKRVIKVRLSN